MYQSRFRKHSLQVGRWQNSFMSLCPDIRRPSERFRTICRDFRTSTIHDSALLHLNQLDTGFAELLGNQGPTSQALASVRQTLNATPIERDQVRLAVADLHTAALTSPTVADFRLGKAYGLGRALGETVLLPVSASDDARPTQFR